MFVRKEFRLQIKFSIVLSLGSSFAQVDMTPSQSANLMKAGLKIAKTMASPITAAALGLQFGGGLQR